MALPTAVVRACARRQIPFLTWLLCGLAVVTFLGCGAQVVQHPVEQQLAAITTQAANQARDASRELKGGDERKIIYTANLTLAVKSLDKTEQQIKQLLDTAEGQLAEFREDRAAGNLRAARWKVRIPPAKFHDFVEQVANLGTAEVRDVQSSDITEEFIDIEARLKNKRQLEARILKLLDEKAGELKDVVTVEGELSRVREEIERIEGRLRYLGSQVQFSTVSIYACERPVYIPPPEPTFRNRLAFALNDSLRQLRELSEAIVIAGVALAPWALLLGIALVFHWFVLSWLLRKRRVTPST